MKFLDQQLDRLLHMADEATLREELTSFPLAASAEQPIQDVHRPGAFSFSA